MPRFFVEPSQVVGGTVSLDGADAEHLARSLRARPGDTIAVVEAGAIEHCVVLAEVGAGRVAGRIEWSRPASGEARLAIEVLQALPAQGMEGAIESMAEVGVAAIRPVISARTVPRISPQAAERRRLRWMAVAREAAQLARRARSPEIHLPVPLADAVAALPPATRLLVCDAVPGALPITRIAPDPAVPVALIIGPEGGFDGSELTRLQAAGAEVVHLGPRILPSRIAGAIAAALVLGQVGDLDLCAAPPPA